MTEAKLKQEVKAYLDALGAYWFMPVQTGYGVKGTPDFLCCLKGRFVAIETKTKGRKPNPWQERAIKQINDAGGLAFWADSLEYAKELLKAGGFVLP